MSIKEAWSKACGWVRSRAGQREVGPAVDDDGLISEDAAVEKEPPGQKVPDAIVKKSLQGAVERRQNAEVFNEAFGKLIGQLQGINEHLGRQVEQHEKLMGRIEQLPELLQSLPGAVENQKQVVDALTEQLKSRVLKDQQFVETIEKIPIETNRQTNALIDMGHKISAVADIDAQMGENFNKFNDTLTKLDGNTANQAESITQMNKTFAASDRYLKYIVSRQNKRFVWIFITSLGISLTAIIALVIAIAMIVSR